MTDHAAARSGALVARLLFIWMQVARQGAIGMVVEPHFAGRKSLV
jgi:hypothetical protein